MSQYFNLPDSPGGGPAAGRARRGPRRSGPAAASLLLGIVGALTHFCLIGYALGAVALVLGIVALVQIGRSNGGQYGKGFAVGGVILSVLVLGYGAHDLLVVSKAGDMSKASNPEFEQAEDNISRKRGDRVAFGNTPAAEAMAGRFSAKFKKLRQSLFTTRGSSGGYR